MVQVSTVAANTASVARACHVHGAASVPSSGTSAMPRTGSIFRSTTIAASDMRAAAGTPTASHPAKSIGSPRSARYSAAIGFGGLPTIVAPPPIDDP